MSILVDMARINNVKYPVSIPVQMVYNINVFNKEFVLEKTVAIKCRYDIPARRRTYFLMCVRFRNNKTQSVDAMMISATADDPRDR